MPNRTVIHLDDSDEEAEPVDVFGDNSDDDDNDAGLGPNEGTNNDNALNDGLGLNEGDLDGLAPNEGDGLGPNEGVIDGLAPNEGDSSPIARHTRSQRGARAIWPIPSIYEAQRQVEQDLQQLRDQRTACA